MMPRGNAEVVRGALDAWGRRDRAAIGELLDEQAEFHSAIVGGVEGGIYRGHEDIERYFTDLDESFEDWHTEDERCLELGGGKVLLLYRIVGEGKASGVPVDKAVGIVFTLRDGKVVLGEVHLDPQEALKSGFEHSFTLFGTEDIDGAVENMDPDIEWEHQPGTGAPEEGLYQGQEQVRNLLGRLREAWDDFRVDVRDVVDTGADKYVVNAVIHARGRISDIELEGDCEYVIEFRDSKAVRIRFLTRTAPVLPSRGASDVT
jgi:ketosteroid isomerase-like protein